MSTEAKNPRRRAVQVAFDMIDTETSAITFVSTRSRERSEYQQELDEIVADAHGKEFGALLCNADETAIKDLQTHLRRSAEFLKLGIRFGDFQFVNDTQVAVTFKVGERRTYNRRPKNEQ